jgi:hypothetical protein
MARRAYDPDRKKVEEWLKMAQAREKVRKEGVVIKPLVPGARTYPIPKQLASHTFQIAGLSPLGTTTTIHADYPVSGTTTTIHADYPVSPPILGPDERPIVHTETWIDLKDIKVADGSSVAFDLETGVEVKMTHEVKVTAEQRSDLVGRAANAGSQPPPPTPPPPAIPPETVGRVEQSFVLARWLHIPPEFIDDAMGDVFERLMTGEPLDPRAYRRLVLSWLFGLLRLTIARVWKNYVKRLPRAK